MMMVIGYAPHLPSQSIHILLHHPSYTHPNVSQACRTTGILIRTCSAGSEIRFVPRRRPNCASGVILQGVICTYFTTFRRVEL